MKKCLRNDKSDKKSSENPPYNLDPKIFILFSLCVYIMGVERGAGAEGHGGTHYTDL